MRGKKANNKLYFKVFAQRIQLAFLIFVLFFGAIEPTLYVAVAYSSSEKDKANYDLIKPLDDEKESSRIIFNEGANDDFHSNTTSKKTITRERVKEDISFRTPFSKTFINSDGSKTIEYSNEQKHYYSNNAWQEIKNGLSEKNYILKDQTKLGNGFSKVPLTFSAKAGEMSADFGAFRSGLKVKTPSKELTFKPIDAKFALPQKADNNAVIYKDVWKDVDVSYEARGESIKEAIIIKSPDAKTEFEYEVIGAKLYPHPKNKGELAIEGLNTDEYRISALTVSLYGQGPISEQVAEQKVAGNKLVVSINKDWLQKLDKSTFPIVIDPTISRGTGIGQMYKSDGYHCNGHNCYFNVGAVHHNGWKYWHGYFKLNYDDLIGKKILSARLYSNMASNQGGDTNTRNIYMSRANCWPLAYAGCLGNWPIATIRASNYLDMDFKELLQVTVDSGNPNWWFGMWGEESNYYTYKPFTTINASITYDTPTPIASPSYPDNGQTIVTDRPTLKINPVSDSDGDAVQYYFRVATKPDAESGAVINSGWINSTSWTVPDGILQDGTIYYWHAYTRGATMTTPNWVRNFKINLRKGRDNTQTYDSLGPVDVNLANGNAILDASTHTMSALGGSIGLNLSYHTPNMSKDGLIAKYWNISSNHNLSAPPTTTPNLTRRENNIDFDWKYESPAHNINKDWFYARYEGYFVAPKEGNYQFGVAHDDYAKVTIKGQKVLEVNCCSATINYTNSTPVYLKAGEVTPIIVDYAEKTSSSYIKLAVKGAVGPIIVPSEWLYTTPVNENQNHGLIGRYYTYNSDRNIDSAIKDPSRLITVRRDTNIDFTWPDGTGPIPGPSTNHNFMARWTGYLTVPTSGNYKIGAYSDDGIRIKLGTGAFGALQTKVDAWNSCCADVWSGETYLTANKPIPIVIDWYDGSGAGSIKLKVRNTAGQIWAMPSSWLTPQASALPDAWNLGVDVDGDVHYESLRLSGNNVILKDSSRSTHEYVWTGSGYKPPLNEDGILNRNADNTFTLTDVDGRIYIFSAEGKLTSLTTPSDDRQPSALKYEYSGNPSRLTKIIDGVTPTRYGTVHYKNINEEGLCSQPAGFDSAPNGMICAFRTSDGNITRFSYRGGNLSRIELPGNQFINYGYDSLGRINKVRDVLANDLIATNQRLNNDELLSIINYDALGRVSKVQSPTPKPGSPRISHSVTYSPIERVTKMHIDGASEPHGFSKKVEYDQLFRTLKVTDLTNKTLVQEWHAQKNLLLSTTTPTGLKSTTIYDSEDRPVESYGPAPSSWYDQYRYPKSDKVSQTPRTSTRYDEGLKGLSVSNYNNKKLLYTPKQNLVSFSSASHGLYLNNSIVGSTDGVSFRATGRILLSKAGEYRFRMYHADGAILRIDDKQITGSWSDKQEGMSAEGVFNNPTPNKWYRIQIDAYRGKTTSDSHQRAFVHLQAKEPGASSYNLNISDWLKPAYNLTTSVKTYDGVLGSNEIKTVYKNPTYGIVDKTILNPGGLSYENKATYEEPGTAFLRQTSKTLPGGGTTQYLHYGKDEKRDNPCTTEVESYPQAGRPKGKIEANPDGPGPLQGRKSETIYNHTGQVVATRYNSDPWTCIRYDARGRVISTTIPSRNENGQNIPGRVITNNYLVGNNPLKTSTSDSSGTITTEIDLLGRAISYADANSNTATNTYDNLGKIISRNSQLGNETFTYDQYDRLTTYKISGATFATIQYDEFSRIKKVDYPSGIKLASLSRDDLQRINKVIYEVSGQVVSDEVARSPMGKAMSGTENGIQKSYTYDKSDRLLTARIGDNSFTYEFGANQNSTCAGLAGNNPNSHKNSNRTRLNINGQITNYCYDFADRLIYSSDAKISTPVYDSHGNTVSLGSENHKTLFKYDSSDRNIEISEIKIENGSTTNKTIKYTRDVSGRIIKRQFYKNGELISSTNYGYNGSGSAHQFVKNNAGELLKKFISLPGGVNLTTNPSKNDASQRIFSLSNLHGDVMATVNMSGIISGKFITGPFGEKLPNHPFSAFNQQHNGSNTPDNDEDTSGNSYVGLHRKTTETEIDLEPIQMGARVYAPILGRFLQVDPVEGGTQNSYVYVNDPVNGYDLNGEFGIFALLSFALTVHAIVDAIIDPTPVNVAIAVVAATPIVGSAVSKLSKTVKITRAASKASKASRVASKSGKAGEAAVASKIGLTKNSASLSIYGRKRIPDFIIKESGKMKAIHEVKNTARLSFTSQIRDYVHIANRNNIPLNLWTRPDTLISGPLQEVIDKCIIIHNIIPK